jgi:predicted MFS family arabinose efflux permease
MLSVDFGLFLKQLTVVELFILMSIEGGCFVFANIGRFSARRFLVDPEQLHEAVAQDSIIEHFALMIGPSLGGFLYQAVGAIISFLADALSYFINAIALSLITSPLSVDNSLTQSSLEDGLKEAAHWIWSQHVCRFYLVLSWTRTIVISALPLLIIVLAKQLHASATTIGIILAISAAAGIVGSFISGKLVTKYNRYDALVVTGTLYTIITALYIFASNIFILTTITALLFALFPSFYIITGRIAGEIPHHIQGRVTSLSRSGDFISYSVGLFLVGFTLQFLGNAWTIVILFLLLAIFTLATFWNKKLLS